MLKTALLHPSGIRVFLPFLVGLALLLLLGVALFGIPQLAAPVFLDYFVLFACVVLARCLHEAPVYHGALMQDQIVVIYFRSCFFGLRLAMSHNILLLNTNRLLKNTAIILRFRLNLKERV